MKKLALKTAKIIGYQHMANEEQIEIYAYSLEIIFGSLLKIILLLFVSSLTNSLYTTIICTLTFVGIRYLGGGVHLSTYLRCLTGSLMILLILGKAASFNVGLQLFLFIFLVVSSLGVYAIIRWVPAGTEEKIITDKLQRRKQKQKAMIFLLFCSLAVLACLYFDLPPIANAITYGLFAAIFLITPLGYTVINSIDKFLNNRNFN